MKTWNEIKQEIITNFPDNNNKEITAERLRTTLTDIANTSIEDKNEAISNFHYYDDEISNMVESLNDYATLSYVNENYYTKTEIDDHLGDVYQYVDEGIKIVVGVERKIGTWTEDGVTYDLYEKIVNVGNLPNSGTLEVLHGVTDKVRFVESSGFAYGNNNINIPFVNDNGSLYIYMGVGNTKITITTNSDRSNLNGYITLRYIRTRG